jgi:hypothetical protein
MRRDVKRAYAAGYRLATARMLRELRKLGAEIESEVDDMRCELRAARAELHRMCQIRDVLDVDGGRDVIAYH